MNRSPIKSSLALSLSTLMLALLTACGGGGDASVAVTDPQAQPAAVPTVCGVSAVPTTGAEAYNVVADQTLLVSGVETQMRLLTSPTGYSYGALTVDLALPLEDLREVFSQGYSPQATTDRMGVEMGSAFAAGSVGCVTGISRVIDIGTEGAPNYLLSWTSAVLPDVPVGSLPNEAVNGFEYTHNFTNKDAYAVFRVSKSVLTDINSAQVCHVNRNGAVDCRTPAVTDEGQQWVLKRAISESGIYLLSATRESVPQD